MNQIQYRIEQALSLRTPQAESLDILARILEKVVLRKDFSVKETLETIRQICPSVKDFERAFPCLCFAIATGVGKTRLMGAMIAYLHTEHKIKNIMVLAPNLTIYNKLKTDFTPNTPKYVFTGLKEFVGTPKLISGDDYDEVGNLLDHPNKDELRINIFNISKIDSDKDARGLPRVRRMAEYLGKSYFEYLSGLKDLVLIMDEAHRYRANAGMAAINELHPVLGIELTATAKTTGSKAQPFQNIVYEYNLAHAIKDGYVKKPAIVGRTDFDKSLYGSDKSEELENLKIKDAVKVHESIKAELQVYADNKKTKLVKPFMMIVAENIKHAEDIQTRIDTDDFEQGRYKGKVIVVNSKQNGELKDEVLQRLLAIERADEPTEIVIHVNMLGEGWDVNNLYTIVPLRAANSKILVEQSIGRGLRLPFGKLTGVDMIDRLHVIAHDKFADIIDAARHEEFEFQKEYIDTASDSVVGKIVQNNESSLDKAVQTGQVIVPKKTTSETAAAQPTLPLFTSQVNKQIGDAVRDAISDVSHYVKNASDLIHQENQKRIVELVQQRIKDIHLDNSELPLEPKVDVVETTKRYTENFIKLSIGIPRIKITYERQEDFSIDDFDIDTIDFKNYQPIPQKVIITELIDKSRWDEINAEFIDLYNDITHYLLVSLMDEYELNYTSNIDLINKLVHQVIDFITAYSGSELNTRKILFFHGSEIAKKIYYQIKAHRHRPLVTTKVKVDSGYAPVTSASYKISVTTGMQSLDYRAPIKDKDKIRNMSFEGFCKCLFSKQKFDSCTEKDLCEILEHAPQVLKWFKISGDHAKEVFDIKYFNPYRQEYGTYLPDFIVETTDTKYMVETKAEKDMDDKTVQAKKDAALRWCDIATTFEKEHGGKPWHYLLIPDTAIVIGRSFEKLVTDYIEG